MLRPRFIPCLLIDDGKLVKTKRFRSPKYVGDPLNVIKIFNEKEVDEIILIDISASKRKKRPDFKLLSLISSECFMPLTYGGGISSLEDASKLFEIGIEKIVLQSSFYSNPDLIRKLVNRFGSQSIVISIDINKNWLNQNKPYSYLKKRNFFKSNLNNIINDISNIGAGEIFLQLVHMEGTKKGTDLSIFDSNLKDCTLPIVISGGVSSLDDFYNYLKGGADAVAAGSFFVFKGPKDAVVISYPKF